MTAELATIERVPSESFTPMALVSLALQQGADLDRLERLMNMQERWEQNEARKAFHKALASFKANPPEIVKDKLVSFGAGKTAYKHATLGQVASAVGAALADFGLSHRWNVEQLDGGMIKVSCLLSHALGHSESVSMQSTADESGGKNKVQAIGSTVTYLERYTLLAATGVAALEQDMDGGPTPKKDEQIMPESEVQALLDGITACKDDAAIRQAGKDALAIAKAAGDKVAYKRITEHTMHCLDAAKVVA
jgi:hypothetical protein